MKQKTTSRLQIGNVVAPAFSMQSATSFGFPVVVVVAATAAVKRLRVTRALRACVLTIAGGAGKYEFDAVLSSIRLVRKIKIRKRPLRGRRSTYRVRDRARRELSLQVSGPVKTTIAEHV